jgi:uncharacterized protein (TIGR02611 family)
MAEVDGLWRSLRFIARSVRRFTVFVVGLVVVLVGIVLIPLPGPGWLVVFTGFAILATEFTWAEILLHQAKKQTIRATNGALRRLNGRQRRVGRSQALTPDTTDSPRGMGGAG